MGNMSGIGNIGDIGDMGDIGNIIYFGSLKFSWGCLGYIADLQIWFGLYLVISTVCVI